MGAVSLRFFSETASAEGLPNLSTSLFLLRDFTSLLGGVAVIITDSTSLSPSNPSNSCLPPARALRILVLLIILLVSTLSPLTPSTILLTVFCFRVELSLHRLLWSSVAPFSIRPSCSAALLLLFHPDLLPSGQVPRTSPSCSTVLL